LGVLLFFFLFVLFLLLLCCDFLVFFGLLVWLLPFWLMMCSLGFFLFILFTACAELYKEKTKTKQTKKKTTSIAQLLHT